MISHDFQKKQLDLFWQRGLPTRKEENWKYTAIPEAVLDCIKSKASDSDCPLDYVPSPLVGEGKDGGSIVLLNGRYSQELSSKKWPNNITVTPLSKAPTELITPFLSKQFDAQHHPFAVLNNAYLREGVFIHVQKNTQIADPIHIIYVTTATTPALITPRNLILLDEGANVSIVEEYVGQGKNYFNNVLTQINVNANARLHYYKIQDEALSANHIATTFIEQSQDSRVDVFTLSKGAMLSREDVKVNLSASGSECHLFGLYTLNHDNQHTDQHLHVDHVAEHCASSMLYKGILDKKSRAVFNGKVYVHPKAQHINAYQANHNLLLSKDAEVNTKPELEIYADDVKCAHGATVGQLDTESLFYLRARGIDKETALALLLDAFADEIISTIDPSVRSYIQKRVGSYVEL